MDELDLIDSKKIPTDSIGNLSILCVLINYDYPRCFIAKSDSAKFYALIENENSFDKYGWNVTEVSLNEINQVNRSKQNVQSLFINKKNSFILAFENNAKIGNIKKVEKFEGKYEIKGNLFVKDFCDMDDLFDLHEIHKKSVRTGKSSISLVLENSDCLTTGYVLSWIKYLSDICKNLKNPLDVNESQLSVQNGSTVITFEFENENIDTIFGGDIVTDSNNIGVNQLGNILGANTPEAIITEEPEIKAINKYTKMIEHLKKHTSAKPKVVLSVPQSDKTVSYKFDEESCSKKIVDAIQAKKLAENHLHNANEIIEVNGVLTGILTGSGKNQFTFKGNDNILYKGLVDFTMLGINSTFIINSVLYKATIKRTIITEDGVEKKRSYKLMDLTFVEQLKNYYQTKLF